MKKRILVTSALPYANGPLHIGHIAGAYLPADIYTRYNRLKGKEILHICGTDEHGVAVTIRAEKEGKNPRQIVDFYHREIKEEFDALHIEFDNFSRTSLPLHKKNSQDFFLTVFKKGYVEKRDTEQYFCPNCNRFLPDRYVEGTCPKCGYEKARGDQCEHCGTWLEPTDLINPRCAICGATPYLKNSSHYYFKLSKLSHRLEDWLKSKTEWKDVVRQFALSWVKEGLLDRSISRDLDWGVPVPLEDAVGKVLYVWFDAPIGYISSTMEWAEKKGDPKAWEQWWKDKDTRLIHFIGKDNIVFHAIVWPAMLMAHGDYILPDDIPANYFLNLEGSKISTSRNWAVWIKDLVKQYPSDYIRFGLTYAMPETKDSDFTFADFKAKVDYELANNVGNFVNRSLKFIKGYMGGRVGPLTQLENEKDRELAALIERAPSEIGGYIEGFHFRKGLQSILKLTAAGNKYFDAMAPWTTKKSDVERTRKTLALCYSLIRALSVLIEPYLPDSARKLRHMLNIGKVPWDGAGNWRLESEVEIGEVSILYKKVEEIIKMEQVKSPEEQPSSEITYEYFSKMKIKIGKIIDAKKVPQSKKLLELKVDIGEKVITLAAGISQYYEPENLIGKEIPVIVNLKPRKLMGILSRGMMLAAVENGKPVLLNPLEEVKPGTDVS